MKKLFFISCICSMSVSFLYAQQAYFFDIKKHLSKTSSEERNKVFSSFTKCATVEAITKKPDLWVLVNWNKIYVVPEEYYAAIERARFRHYMWGIPVKTTLPQKNNKKLFYTENE